MTLKRDSGYTYSGIALHNKDSKAKEYHLLTEIFSLPNEVVKTYGGAFDE